VTIRFSSSIVLVEIGNSPIGCDLGVDVTTFTFVHVDLGFESFDFLGLNFKKLFDLEFLFKQGLLLFVILIHEDSLDGVIKLFVKLNFFFTKLTNQVEEIGVVLHFTC
jgi:hypothetical protein